MVNAREKGKAAERQMRRILADWWGGVWERRRGGVPGSDLIAPADFPYEPEVKHRATVRTQHIFKPTLELVSFWQQTKEQTPAHKEPLLCIKIEGAWWSVTRRSQWELSPKTAATAIWGDDEVLAVPIQEFMDCHNRGGS